MFTDNDIRQITSRGSELEKVTNQVENFRKGFPYLQIM